jgi:hypothetical protein
MVLGNLKAWTGQFISVDERLLERISFVWKTCVNSLPSQPLEDNITINLVSQLSNDAVVRRICHWIEFQYEPFGINQNGSYYSKGKVDMAAFLDWNRERYIAYECKRLNVTRKGKRISLAGEYVSEGMMRFMTSQYAEALPIGCMLGYVIDGDLIFAMKQLKKKIVSHPPLHLVKGPSKIEPKHQFKRFNTKHNRPADITIELRHALLPF